ncbi:MAG: molecular chaperone [Alphaproteobacteria bacterium]|nr:molecular chaperone [Alphaproteobacteria bacterium]
MLKKICLYTLLACLAVSKAYAGFTIFPMAVDFEENSRKRSQTLNIMNSSNELQTYRVNLVQYKQNEQGKFEEVETMENSAKDFLVFSPKQFTLKPGKTQAIRVARKGLGNMADGESVTHLVVREVEMPRVKKATEEGEEDTLSVSVKVLQAIGIPVTILKGKDLYAKTEVESAKVKDGKVEVVLNRLGNISSRVKLIVKDEKGEEIGRTDNVRIYLPNTKRTVSVSLKKDVKTKPTTLVLEDGLTGKEILQANISK